MKWIRILLSTTTATIIYHLFIFYIGWNIFVWLTTSFQWYHPIYFSVIFLLFAYSFIIGRIRKWKLFKIIGMYWIAFFQYALLLFPIANIVVFLSTFIAVSLDTVIYWTGIIVLGAFVFIFLYGSRQAYSPVIRKYKLEIKKRNISSPSLTIAVASDMHFGLLSGRTHLRRMVEQIQKVKPDLILLPGDIVDDDPSVFIEKDMGVLLKSLQAPLGVYGVLGNHEYYGGEIPAFVKEMKNSNVTILQDEIITLKKSITLIGRKDKTDKNREPISSLMSKVDDRLPIIMMDHQPFELEEAMKAGIDLIVCGHTHRGQMAPNHLITKKMYELDWGYKQKEQLHAIVSSGYGFWGPPIRLGSRSEIVQIDITFHES